MIKKSEDLFPGFTPIEKKEILIMGNMWPN